MSVPVAVASLLLVAGMLSGCTGADADDAIAPPSGSASPSESPRPTPSASPTPPAPVSPVAGGCPALAASDAVVAASGGVQRVTTLDQMWHIAIETEGGLACSLLTSRLAVDAYLLPTSLATGRIAALLAAPTCDRGAGSMECHASAPGAGQTALVAASFPTSVDDATALGELGGIAAAVAASATEGTPAPTRATTWSHPLDCRAIGETIGVTSLLGSDEARTALGAPPAATVDGELAIASSTTARCDWTRTPTQKGDRGSEFSVISVPGGAWAWKTLAASVSDAVDTMVGGHPARVTSRGEVYLSDGVNILHLQGQRLAGVSVVDTALGVLSVIAKKDAGSRG
ncbi:hypothetical protein GCM10009806_05530 [Microbacterium flavum]